MSKKIKGVAFDSSPPVSIEDARARFKHQTLHQDYLNLQQETEAARSKLEAMKQKKLTLQAEVGFLKRRHKFLLKSKSSAPHNQIIVKPQYVETTQHRKSKKENVYSKKEATFRNLSPVNNVNQNGKLYTKTKVAPPVFDLNQKELSFHIATHASNLNPRNNSSPVLDLDRKEGFLSGKEAVGQSRAPVFDLNQISREEEEEELEECYEPFEEQRKGLVKSGIDEKVNDLKLSMCRNVVGGGSTSRTRKRKISWQDPVALRV